MAKSALKERPRKSPAGQPAEFVRKAKIHSEEPKKALKTLADFKADEEAEHSPKDLRGQAGSRMKLETVEQEVMGSNFSKSPWTSPAWVIPGGNVQMTVSYWFPSVGAIIDYPDTEAEATIKTKAFKTLKIPYISILPEEPLNIEEARAKLRAQGAKV